MRTGLLALVSIVLPVVVSSAEVAHAQVVYVSPPRVVIHAPPVPLPRFVRRVRVVRVPAPPVVVYPPPPAVYAPAPPVQIYAPPPEPYYVAPQQLPPIPPPIVAPAPTVYVAPTPTYYAPPPPPVAVTVAAPAPVKVSRPAFRSQFGLGLRGSGYVQHDKFHGLGVGGELLIRISPHWTSELAGEYQRNTSGATSRMDIPLTLGMRVHLAKPSWMLQPYLVGALGVDLARQDLKVFEEKAYFFEGQVGGGLEMRLGKHVALTADARFVGRYRVDKAEQETLSLKYVDGKPVSPLGNSYGGQFRLGVQVYF